MPGNQENFHRAMNLGHSAAWDQEWEKAIQLYRQALEEFPDNPQALTSLGLAYFEAQNYENALVCYQKASQRLPNDPVPHEKMGRIYERQGKIREAVQSFLQAAEQHLRARDVEKAIDNWTRVTFLNPEHLATRTRLAGVYERLGRKQDAVREYIAAGSILQSQGELGRALQVVENAQKIMPDNRDAAIALQMLRTNKPLPRPQAPKTKTGPLRMAAVKQMEVPKSKESGESDLDPLTEARQKALVQLAALLFEQTDDSSASVGRKGLTGLTRSFSGESESNLENSRVILHLGQAIDAQTHGDEAQAAQELERAVEAGLKQPASAYNLGLLLYKKNPDRALKYLQEAVHYPEYSLPAYILMGRIHQNAGRYNKAVTSFLIALSLADSQIVPPQFSDEVRQLYDSVIETQAHHKDAAAQKALCETINNQLCRPDWRQYLKIARQQLPPVPPGSPPLPVVELMLESHSAEVIEAISKIADLRSRGFYRSAMEEAFHALSISPSYLPLHSQMAEILIAQENNNEAVQKLITVSELYQVKGEGLQAVRTLQRALQLAPSNIDIRTRLINLLVDQNRIEDALHQYIELAEFYYMIAELETSRQTYLAALQLAQKSKNVRYWGVRILTKVADIDTQRLNLRQAMRIYEQIRTMQPDDVNTRQQMVFLNFRLGQEAAALAEVENFVTYLEGAGKRAMAIEFVKNVLTEHPDRYDIQQILAELYVRARQIPQAVEQMDALADALLQVGNRPKAISILEMIVKLNPPNVKDYQQALEKLRS